MLNYYTYATTLVINILKNSNDTIKRMDNNQEIISRLKFIGHVKKGEKINTRYMYVQPDGIGTMLSRTFIYQDNRGNLLNFCQETINRAFELLVTYERSECQQDKLLFNNLILDLKNAISGIVNIKSTYVTDTKFCCDMDTLLQNTEARLDKYQKSVETIDKRQQ